MAFRKIIVVLSGRGSTGLVKLSGSFDGLNKVKCECRCDAAGADARLFIIADDVTEIHVENAKTTFEVPISAKSDVYCLLYTGGKTLLGSSGGRADRRQLESRIDLYRRERARAAKEKRESEARLREAAEQAAKAETERRVAAEAEETAHGQPSSGADGNVRGENGAYSQSVLREGVAYDGTNFYQAVKPQIDEMFVRYPAEERLNALVPNSKWVRVDTDAEDYYVLGVLFDLSLPIFVCYGIPGVRSVPPPRDIADVSVWLPLDNRRPDGDGFWVIYQSATDGKCIR